VLAPATVAAVAEAVAVVAEDIVVVTAATAAVEVAGIAPVVRVLGMLWGQMPSRKLIVRGKISYMPPKTE
jgi:hypothetical protein